MKGMDVDSLQISYVQYAIRRVIKDAAKYLRQTPISQFRMGKSLQIGQFWQKIYFFHESLNLGHILMTNT